MPRLNELQDTLLPWRKLQGCRTLAASADGVDTHTHTGNHVMACVYVWKKSSLILHRWYMLVWLLLKIRNGTSTTCFWSSLPSGPGEGVILAGPSSCKAQNGRDHKSQLLTKFRYHCSTLGCSVHGFILIGSKFSMWSVFVVFWLIPLYAEFVLLHTALKSNRHLSPFWTMAWFLGSIHMYTLW